MAQEHLLLSSHRVARRRGDGHGSRPRRLHSRHSRHRLMSVTASRELLSPQVKRGERGGNSYWYGFAFEFRLDASEQIVRLSKEGMNAGVASMFAWYPGTDTTLITLANQDCDIWKMHDEIEAAMVLGR